MISQNPTSTFTAQGGLHEVAYDMGLLLFGVGSVLGFVAMVAWGVMLGMRAAD